MRRHRTHVIRKGLRSGEISRRRPSQAPNVSSKPSSHVCTPSTDPRDVVLPEWKHWGLCGKSWSKIWVIAWANALKECPIDWSRSSISWWTKLFHDTSKFWAMILLCCFPKLQEWRMTWMFAGKNSVQIWPKQFWPAKNLPQLLGLWPQSFCRAVHSGPTT